MSIFSIFCPDTKGKEGLFALKFKVIRAVGQVFLLNTGMIHFSFAGHGRLGRERVNKSYWCVQLQQEPAPKNSRSTTKTEDM